LHSATGGLAIAKTAAMGGLAVAYDYAVGGSAYAIQANTEQAKSYVQRASYAWLMEWYIKNQFFGNVILIAPAILSSSIMRLFYRRELV
ncbi:MAG: hypothetical protein ABL921_24205, partial [Pirellula sp.]